jgi:hypothetical protein
MREAFFFYGSSGMPEWGAGGDSSVPVEPVLRTFTAFPNTGSVLALILLT